MPLARALDSGSILAFHPGNARNFGPPSDFAAQVIPSPGSRAARVKARTSIGNMLLWKMFLNALPLFVRQLNHSAFILHQQRAVI